MSIYVETQVRGQLEDLWQRTQDPSLHERWDLRFSEIYYLPRRDDEPQRFRYETRIGFGLRIRGEGRAQVAAMEPMASARLRSGSGRTIPSRSSGRAAATGATSRPLMVSVS
jgi:hypothetical protein